MCSWHVEVYAKLTMVQQLLTFLDSNHPQFAEYMRANYFNHLEEWCYAYRVGTLTCMLKRFIEY